MHEKQGTPGRVTVIGAGIVGVTCALRLRREGWAVTLMDRTAPGRGASFGNAGLIGPHAILPTALPGTILKVPGWIVDPMGPVAVDPLRLLWAAPWFMRWGMLSGLKAAMAQASFLSHLNHDVIKGYRVLLGSDGFDEHICMERNVTVWRNRPFGPTTAAREKIYAENGIETEELIDEALWSYIPALSHSYRYGLAVSGSAFIRQPNRLIENLFGRFINEGGIFLRREVGDFICKGDRVTAVATDSGELAVDTVVLATGANSSGLARKLGQRVLVEPENGYHVMFDTPADHHLSRPIVDAHNKVAITPMDDGLRVTGFAEFRGLDAKAIEKRKTQLVALARQTLPDLRQEPTSFWMGSRPSTPGSVPIIERSKRYPNAIFAFGHGHYGMSGAPGTSIRVLSLCTQ